MRTSLTGIPPASRTCTSCSRCAHRACPKPSYHPSHTSPRIARPAFDSAARDGVQCGHLQLGYLRRHGHESHVRAPSLPITRPAPRPVTHALLSTAAGRGGLQPAAELRHVPRHEHGRHVRGALTRACPARRTPQSRVLRVRAVCARRCPTRPSSPAFRPAHLASYRTPYFRPRQAAVAFNQPVNFNTSRVTNMAGMFLVRSPRVLGPPSPPSRGSSVSTPLAPATALRALAPPPSGLHTSPRIARPTFDSAGRGGLQPAAELRHLPRHEHERHVYGALTRACPAPQPPSRWSST
eukprot:scaffold18824_cov49-Phaeocystis_antarctica.AAC.2